MEAGRPGSQEYIWHSEPEAARAIEKTLLQKHKNKISYLVINKNEEVIENSDIYTNNVLEQMYLVINNLNSKKGR